MLERYDKRTGMVAPVSVARAAVVRDIYTLPAETGHAADALEMMFAAQESVIAPIIRRLRSLTEPGHYRLDPVLRDGLAGYIAMLHMRSPTYRDVANRRIAWFGSIEHDMQLNDPGRFANVVRASGWQGTEEELEAYRLSELEAFRSGRLFLEAAPISSMGDLRLAIDQLRPILMERRWVVVRRERWPYLVLGDQPVTLLGPSGALGDIGFAVADNEVLIPLASDCLLTMGSGPHSRNIEVVVPDRGRYDSLAAPWWLQANVAAWRTSGRFVFARCQADLDAVALAMHPDLRQAVLPSPSYGGGDPAWAGYARRLGITRMDDSDL
jgi:hypothetical protein